MQIQIFTALQKGFSPLHTACEKGETKTVKRLLENRADVNLRDANGFTPLFIACKHDNKDIVQSLLEETAKEISRTETENIIAKYILSKNIATQIIFYKGKTLTSIYVAAMDAVPCILLVKKDMMRSYNI